MLDYIGTRLGNNVENIAGFVHLQRFKNPGFYRDLFSLFPGLLKPGMKIIMFTMNCSKQHLIVNIITVKQQCAPGV